jgi:anti-sigma28 factor (negative regulator of flagellin synthesis)
MSGINSIGPNTPIQKVLTQPVQKQVSANAPKQLKLTDRVEIGNVKQLLATIKANDVRTEKVTTIRSQIEAGTYETEAKLDSAIDRMMDDLSR